MYVAKRYLYAVLSSNVCSFLVIAEDKITLAKFNHYILLTYKHASLNFAI